MSDSQDQGEDQKNQGEDGKDTEDGNTIELTKKDLSDKILDGRKEGISKGKREVLSAVNETLGTDYDSVDSLSEDLSEAHIGDIEESDVVQDLQGKLKEAKEKNKSYEKKIQDIRTKNQVKSEFSEQLGDKDSPLSFDELKTLAEANGLGYKEKDGEIYATEDGNRFLNDEGEYMKFSEALFSFAQEKGLIQGNASGGTGGKTNPKSKGKDSSNPFISGNVTEQAKLYRQNPEKAQRLKKQAEAQK